jgi:hypothetical protein
MSVDEPNVVDVASIDKAGYVVLTISDHLDWTDSVRHQTILQEKINHYLSFVESGEILEGYPDAKNRPVAIKVVFQHDPDDEGERFLERVKEVIEPAGFNLRHETFVD